LFGTFYVGLHFAAGQLATLFSGRAPNFN
jgi:hypothetical protein